MELRKVLMDCFVELKKVLISEVEVDSRFLYVSQVGMSPRENDRVLSMVASQRVKSELKLDEGE